MEDEIVGVARGRELFREDRLIWWLLLVAVLLRAAAIADIGVAFDRLIDAQRYVESARIFAASGAISFAGTAHSAYQMPGFAILLAPFFLLPAGLFTQMLLVKIALLAVSVASIYVLYLIGARIGGTRVGLVAAALLTFSLPHIYAGNLTLSENPFMLGLLLTTLWTIRLADSPGWKPFAVLLAAFVVTVYLKQAVLGFLLPALVYLLVRRYPRALLLKQVCVAIAVALLVLAPWWVRNYRVFATFVPFTSFDGAPFYEGTFQRFQPYGNGAYDGMEGVVDPIRGSEIDRSRTLVAVGRERIAARWAADPIGLVVTYAVMKPAAAWLIPFYWDAFFGIDGYWVLRIHAALSALGLALLAWYSIRSRSRAEFLLLLLNVLVISAGSAYYLGLSRCVYPYVPMLYVAVGIGAVRLADSLSLRPARRSE